MRQARACTEIQAFLGAFGATVVPINLEIVEDPLQFFFSADGVSWSGPALMVDGMTSEVLFL